MDFGLGVIVGILVIVLILKMFVDAVIRSVETRVQTVSTEVVCKLEEINGVFYLYDNTNNTFLAQGKTLEDIKNFLKIRKLPYNHIRVEHGDTDAIKKLLATEPV
jgi:hypothetical protein